MPQDRLDPIREGVAALNRRDVEGMVATLHPEVQLEPLRAVLEGTVYEGHQGLRDWLEDMSEEWEEQSVDLIDLRELDSGEVLVEALLHVRYRGSGVEVDQPGVWLCELRDGLVSRIRFYRDVESAMEASGASGT